jgi:hypothetical protein
MTFFVSSVCHADDPAIERVQDREEKMPPPAHEEGRGSESVEKERARSWVDAVTTRRRHEKLRLMSRWDDV